MKGRLKKEWSSFVNVSVAVIVINIVSGFFYTRIDLTAERRFTLSDVSKNILQHIPEKVKIEVLLGGDLPAGFKHLRSETIDMLSDLKAFSDGRLQFSLFDPLDASETRKQQNIEALASKGLKPVSLNVKTNSAVSQQLIFPAVIVSYDEQEMIVSILENRMGIAPEEALNNSIQNLEYNLVSAISKVTSQGKPLVGFTEGHGELDDVELADGMKSLHSGYITGRVDLERISLHDLHQLSVLVIAKPTTSFSESEKYKISAFVRKGGGVVWAVDQTTANLDSLSFGGEQLAIAQRLNLDDILFKYGVRLNYNLIEDLNCAQIPISVGDEQIKLLPWMFYPLLMPLSSHPIVKNLEAIKSEFVGSLDTVAASGITKEIILSSSPFSKVIETPSMISLQMIDQLTDMKSFKGQTVPVAVLLEGVFPDIFKNRPLPPGIKEGNLADTVLSAKMLVVADGDIFKNQISSKDRSPFPLGYDQYSQHQYGNESFLMNVIDYLADDAQLIELRQKEIRLRLLDKVKIENEGVFWQFLNVGLPLLILIFAGFIQYFRRKRKYGLKPVNE